MFRNCIRETEFTSRAAGDLFHNIVGDPLRGDVTFISTLRALISPRIAESDSLRFSVTTANFNTSLSDRGSVSDVCDAAYYLGEPKTLTVLGVSIHEDKEDCFRRIRENFEDLYDGWHCVERITALYKKAFQVLCYIEPDKQSSIIFVENLDLRKFHYLQCCIPGALPWYFTEEHKVNEEEFHLIDSLRKHECDEYLAAIKVLSNHYDFRSATIKEKLKGFETKYEQIQRDSLAREIENIDLRMDELMESMRSYNADRETKSIQLLGLDTKISSSGDSSELMDYFLLNKNLFLEEVGAKDFVFSVKTQIMYYDEEVFERCVNNRTSFVYTSDRWGVISKEDMTKLLRAIFVEEVLHINTCACFNINLQGSFEPCSRHTFGVEFNHCMPNPHINNYGCMGNYVMTINELLRKHDYVSAIEQCIASTQSVNWTDTIVMSRFMEELYNTDRANNQFIVLPNGDEVSPKEAINWLKEREKGASENE